jgi:HD-GYP domain-containing protein (c-di-GMP phosphodiesterase class II)
VQLRGASGGQPLAGDSARVAVLITLAASAAIGLVVNSATDAWEQISGRPAVFAVYVLLTLAFQVVVVEVYGRGTVSFAGTGKLAVGFAFGPGAGMATAVLMGLVLLLRRRGKVHRGAFNAANFALATGAGATVYHALVNADSGAYGRLGAACLAGGAFCIVNMGLLSFAMSLSERSSALALWQERFRWFTPYYLASGPLALALILAQEKVGITGMLAFALPPVLMMLSVRQYIARTRQSVEDVRTANEELQRANRQLAERNDDLQDLFQFTGGLAARAHDRSDLVTYAESCLARLMGVRPLLSVDVEEGAIALVAGGKPVGSLRFERDAKFDADRWNRLRDAVLPQLSTAIESATLVTVVRKKHLATIAALSRSMEAKDGYTGGHTERVSDLAVAIGRRLGYSGDSLDAIEIGALLHDVGKIGIPEHILHKTGPLNEEEWEVMKRHPVISEYILSEVELSPIVTQIARSSHERVDGHGYPDGLAGDEIPLPARIVLVADAFDALTSDRPYRNGRSVEAALSELRLCTGTQFCPLVMDALERVYREEPQILGANHLRVVAASAA